MITYLILYLMSVTLVSFLIFRKPFHPVNVFHLWTLIPFLVYYMRPYGDRISYVEIDIAYFALIVLSSSIFFVGAVTALCILRSFRKKMFVQYKTFMKTEIKESFLYYFGVILIVWSGYYLYDTYNNVYSLYDFSSRVGLRSTAAFNELSIANKWWIEEFALSFLILFSAYNAYNLFVLKRKNSTLLALNWLSVLLYVMATLGRGRLVDVVMIYIIMFAASKKFALRRFLNVQIFVYFAIFILIYISVSYFRTDESLYDDSFFEYFMPHIAQYFTNGISFTQYYLSQPFEGANGSYTFRHIYLVLSKFGIDISTETPRYGVFSLGELVTFSTPSMLTWIDDDFGIIGILLFYYVYGVLSVIVYDYHARTFTVYSYAYITVLLLFMYKSLLTYPLYDLWFWLVLISIPAVTKVIYSQRISSRP